MTLEEQIVNADYEMKIAEAVLRVKKQAYQTVFKQYVEMRGSKKKDIVEKVKDE